MLPTIQATDISKIYRIYDNKKDRIKETFSFCKHKEYGRNHYALNNVSFDMYEGELLGVIGANGCGKSTLLKIITGVLTPTTGSVIVRGKISSLLELGAGFNPDYTGMENIYFNGMVMGFSKAEMEKRVDDIVAFADIGEYIHQPVRTYSSGMYVRLAYAAAICIEPDILIVDEALAVGDAFFQMKAISRMQDLFQKGKNVIFVSHDTGSVKSMCTKALYLEKGAVVAYGPAKDVVEMYECKVRDEMSSIKKVITSQSTTISLPTTSLAEEKTPIKARLDRKYEKRVAYSREGSGEARVRCVELLDLEGKLLHSAVFNQTVILRMHVEFIEDCSISVGYHIRDDKNIYILGSSSVFEQNCEVSGTKGEWIVADFCMSLPLQDGRYNVLTVLSHLLIADQAAAFIDVTKDGCFFQMAENSPRIWNKVQLPNSLSIKKATLEDSI